MINLKQSLCDQNVLHCCPVSGCIKWESSNDNWHIPVPTRWDFLHTNYVWVELKTVGYIESQGYDEMSGTLRAGYFIFVEGVSYS